MILKNLNDVTLEDATAILQAGYPHFFQTGKWKIEDYSEAVKEPAMRMHSRSKAYDFVFYKDCIDIDFTDPSELAFDGINFDVNFECYVQAVKLGYYVPKISELLQLRFNEGAGSIILDSAGMIQTSYVPTVESVKTRIQAEYAKHKDSELDWALLAAKKIVGNINRQLGLE
jgi:hypothetical protein